MNSWPALNLPVFKQNNLDVFQKPVYVLSCMGSNMLCW